jgi:hypothetical protein
MLSQQEYEELLALGGQNTQDIRKLKHQQTMAEMLRQQGDDALGAKQAGGYTVGPTPLGAVAGIAAKGLSGLQMAKMAEAEQSMGAREARQRALVLKAILGQQKSQPGVESNSNPLDQFTYPQGML